MQKIAVLLTNVADGKQVGLIELAPEGLLVFQSCQADLPWFSSKSVERFLGESVLKEPLYKKHARLLKRKRLPEVILEQEAKICADAINQADPPRKVREYTIKAQVVHYTK